MLPPDSRAVAMDLLKPPPGATLDFAVLTTYGLDLEALLALPIAVLAHADGGVEDLLDDPLMVIQAFQSAGDRVHVFVDETGIGVPRKGRELYALLESSVHPVRAPNGGVFHPKVWLARFVHEDERAPVIRVAIMSRNLTFDRAWDVALVSGGQPRGKQRRAASRALGDLVRALPELSTGALEPAVVAELETLADQAERTAFPAPDGFESHVTFHALGLNAPRRKVRLPVDSGSRVLAVAPFVNRTAADEFAALASDSALVSRQECLDELSEDALAQWATVLVLGEDAEGEPEDEVSDRPGGLHAKLFAVEQGWYVTWLLGSANLTAAAFLEHNVEMMAELRGKKSRHGIEPFLEGFAKLCMPYRRSVSAETDPEVEAARRRLEQTRAELLRQGALRVVCAQDGDGWTWTLEGGMRLPAGVRAQAWPVSVAEDQASNLVLPVSWKLPVARLTAFVAIRLSADGVAAEDLRFTLKVPATGIPEHRLAQVLRTLIDSPERFLRFLRALLGGLEGLVPGALAEGAAVTEAYRWLSGLRAESLLEDLVRIASQEPHRLEPVRRLMQELGEADDFEQIIPEGFLALWTVVDEVVQERSPT